MDQEGEEGKPVRPNPVEASTGLPARVLDATKIYPFIQGVSGVPFAQILAEAQRNKELSTRGETLSGSGRIIKYKVGGEGRFINIEDEQWPYFTLACNLGEENNGGRPKNVLDLFIYSRPTRNVGVYNFLNKYGYHPDFYARKFLRFALAYYAARGLPIDAFKGNWIQEGTNWNQFMQIYKETGDEVKAAENTWTVQQLRDLGFRGSISVDVGPDKVTAYLKRH